MYSKRPKHTGLKYALLLISLIIALASGIFFWPIVSAKYNLYSSQPKREKIQVDNVRKPKTHLLKATYENLVYANVAKDNGEMKDLKMNIFKPFVDNGPTPVLIYIHGGGWSEGDYDNGYVNPVLKEGDVINITNTDSSKNANFRAFSKVIDKGITFVSIGYRLSNEAIFPAQIFDVKGSVRYLKANAAQYGIDPTRIAVIGDEAGGQLALLLGMTAGNPKYEGDVGGNLEFDSGTIAVVDFYGPTNLLTMAIDGNSRYISRKESIEKHDTPTAPEAKLLGYTNPEQGVGVLRGLKNKKKVKEPDYEKVMLAEMASPLQQVRSSNPPIFIVHGVKNNNVPIRQSLKLADALLRADVENIYITNSEGDSGYQGDFLSEMAIEWVAEKLNNRK